MTQGVVQSSNGILERLGRFRERHGGSAALYKLADQALHKVFRIYVHDVVWLDVESLPEMAPPEATFAFRFLTPDEVAEFAKDESYYIGPEFLEYVRQGRLLCFAALSGERLAAYGCYTLGSVPRDQAGGASMLVPPNVAYMSNGFTHADFRGARLHGLLMGLALKELGKGGVTKLASLVEWTNWSSLKSCDRLGYERLGRMVTIGGPRRAAGFYPKRAKRLGILFGRKAR